MIPVVRADIVVVASADVVVDVDVCVVDVTDNAMIVCTVVSICVFVFVISVSV